MVSLAVWTSVTDRQTDRQTDGYFHADAKVRDQWWCNKSIFKKVFSKYYFILYFQNTFSKYF